MHAPVLCDETLDGLVTSRDGIYVDCTAGGGGHLQGLARRLGPEARIIGLDRDADILAQTADSIIDQRVTLVHADFRDLRQVLQKMELNGVNGIMMDLGVSSFQLDQSERGFSFHADAALDMRMDRGQELSAAEIVNSWAEEELARIIFEYGEERYSRRIARAIIRKRKERPIATTLELVEAIKSAVPGSYKGEKHPARRTFQALRIAVNDELGALQSALPQAVEMLVPGGRLAVISFHSLEDRLVKRYFNQLAAPCTCPVDIPVCICGLQPVARILKRKAVKASEQEIEVNPRARSARLRVIEKL